ncbi:MAG: protein translocase subunit SecD [Armatimonadota bacterium]
MKHYQILILIIVLVLGSIAVVVKMPTKRGLDLAGGVRIVLRAKTGELEKGQTWDRSKLSGIIGVLRNRIDAFGVSEPQIVSKGSDQIIVELPDIKNVDDAVKSLQGTARMEFRHLIGVEDKRHPTAKYKISTSKDENDEEVVTILDVQGDDVTKKAMEESPLIMTGNDIMPTSKVTSGSNYSTVVAIEFNAEGRKKFAEFTRRNVDEYLAIILDGKILSAPTIRVAILDGKAVIEGSFTSVEAKKLADYINAGALPVPLEIIQSQRVEATLGQASVDSSIRAGVLGLALVVLFMIIFYLLPGVIADIALCIYALITFALFKLIPVTLTLPGIAAFILSVGMAVDANILIFERLKEELRSGKTLKAAIDAGFGRAFTSIFDSNMCTAITCGILMYYGTGPIKGFALVLFLGVAVSMFTAITATRTMLYLVVNTGLASNLKLFGLKREWVEEQSSVKHLDIVKRMWIWFTLSAVFIIPGLIALAMGGLKGGIDFTGGNMYQVEFSQPVTSAQIQTGLEEAGFADSIIQGTQSSTTAASAYFIRTKEIPIDKSATVKAAFTALGGKVLSEDVIGAAVSKELTQNAFWAVILASIAIILYLTGRFAVGGIKVGFRFGVCAVAALVHDVLFIIGAFAIFGLVFKWEVDSLFVTALLTIIGFSVHDTIVIFDRIRENMKHRVRGEEFDTLVNKSILQSLTRSINTSFTVFLTLLALLVLGAASIRQFVIALLIGIIIGTYSSIFNASQLLVLWQRLLNKQPALAGAGADVPKATATKPVAPSSNEPDGDGEVTTKDAVSKPKSSGGSKKNKRRF